MPTKKPPTTTKKPAAKKAPAKVPPTQAPLPTPEAEEPGDAEPQFALAELSAELGTADPALLAAFLQDTPDSELVERGTRIGSPKVVTDGARMLGIGWTFYKGATAAQKQKLRGCSKDLFALAVTEMLRLEKLVDQQAAQRQHEAGVREVSAVAQGTAWNTAMSLRDQAESALGGAAGSRELRAAVSEAVGTAETGAALARGLESLAKTLEGWIGQAAGADESDQALKLRLELFSLDADYAKELRQAAEALRQSDAKTKNPPQTARIGQVQLDRQDGVCLLLLDRVMRAFERGHALDPTIPRLVPRATRSILAPRRSTRKDKPSVPAPALAPPAS